MDGLHGLRRTSGRARRANVGFANEPVESVFEDRDAFRQGSGAGLFSGKRRNARGERANDTSSMLEVPIGRWLAIGRQVSTMADRKHGGRTVECHLGGNDVCAKHLDCKELRDNNADHSAPWRLFRLSQANTLRPIEIAILSFALTHERFPDFRSRADFATIGRQEKWRESLIFGRDCQGHEMTERRTRRILPASRPQQGLANFQQP